MARWPIELSALVLAACASTGPSHGGSVPVEVFEGAVRARASEALLDVLTKAYLQPEHLERRRLIAAVVVELPRRVPEIWMRSEPRRIVVESEGRALGVRCAQEGPSWDLVLCFRRLVAAIGVLADIDATAIDQALAESVVSALDDYTRVVWTPFESCDFAVLEDCPDQDARVGLALVDAGPHIVVAQVLPSSPALRAGIRPGDRIRQIDGLPASEFFAAGAARHLRGDAGSVVLVGVDRPGVSTDRVHELHRERVEGGAVQWRRLADDIGWLRIHTFDHGVARQVAGLISRERPKGLVLDLRDNPGGVLRDAVRVADLLMDRGVLFTLQGRRRTEPYEARVGGAMVGLPVVVLVNERTASAAELLAGTLQHHRRATLIGQRTFGKGSVQVPFELPGGFMMATIGHYTVGMSVPVHKRGVAPDVWLPRGDVDGDEALSIAVERIRGSPRRPRSATPPAFSAELSLTPARADAGQVAEVRVRVENLGDAPLTGLSARLTSSEPRLEGLLLVIPTVAARSTAQVVAALATPASISDCAAELGLQWFHDAGAVRPVEPAVAYLQLDHVRAPHVGLQARLADADGVLVPDELAQICMVVANFGGTPLVDGFISVDARRGPLALIDGPLIRVGRLDAGAQLERCAPVVARSRIGVGEGRVDIVWGEWGGQLLGRRTLIVPTARTAGPLDRAREGMQGWLPLVELAVVDGRLMVDGPSVEVRGTATAVSGQIRDLVLHAGVEKIAYVRGDYIKATVPIPVGGTALTLTARTDRGHVRTSRIQVVRRR